jgi:hypothetical protein
MQNAKEVVDKSFERWQAATYDARKEVEKKISDMIGPTSLSLEISASSDVIGKDDEWVWNIHIKANEHNVFDEKRALSWNWNARLNPQGDVVKDSGSWSGLRAVTAEQIADLEESVRVIKILNSIDWNEFLHSNHPASTEYINEEDEVAYNELRKNRPDFETELALAHLEDLIGQNVAVKLSSDEYWRGPVWIIPTGVTDKFVKGYIFPDYFLDDGVTADSLKSKVDERRTSKNKLVIEDKDLVVKQLA